MKRIACWLLLLLAVGCTPVFRVTTPIPVVTMGDGQLHQAACDTPSALCGGPALPAPHVGPTPAPHRFGAGFPDAVPLASLTQSGATSTQVIAWNGTSWAPANGGGSPTGTGIALVSGGSFVGAAGPVDLSSSTYVANALGLANGGTGTSLSCSSNQLVLGASSSALGCYTMSGDGSMSAGALTVGSLLGGTWTVFTNNPVLKAAYQGAGTVSSGESAAITQSSPTSDLGTADVVVKAMSAYAGASTNVTGGNVDLVAGTGATSNGTPGNVSVYLPAPTGSGADAFLKVYAGSINYALIGGLSGYAPNYSGIWLSNTINPVTLPGFWNAALFTYGNNTFVEGYTGVNIAVGSATALAVTSTAITTSVALNPGASNVSIVNCNGGTTTLGAAQSATTMLIVACQTGTTASTVKSALAPAVGTLWIVRNGDTTSSITFEWSSGTGVTLTHGTSAVLTSDGTNAIAVMQGT